MTQFTPRAHDILRRFGPVAGLVGLSLAASMAFAEPDDDEDVTTFDFEAAPVEAMMMAPSAAAVGEFGATPGGAQDIAFARDRIAAGEVPHPDTFTPEGLFSEHDLPLPSSRCQKIICVVGASMATDLIAQPEVRALGQLGFSSGLDPKTWRRAPLNLIAVIDKSGSMSGAPLNTVKASLHQLVEQLGEGDRLGIVLYGDRAHVHLDSTPVADRKHLHAIIDGIQSRGSTAMEAGLKVGFELARQSARRHEGVTRVMLFTDERPNVGATDKGSFMGMARAASADGIGMTTIGVGTHFGAALATAVSSVRGGNLFFFPDATAMEIKFAEELDTMVTELAYDMHLVVEPGQGWSIAGLYGLPGDLVKRTPTGGLELGIETIFLSRKKGAIFVAFAPEGGLPPVGAPGRVSLTYTGTDGAAYRDGAEFTAIDGALPLGLARGALLVDQATALKAATALHLQQNDQEGAFRMVRALKQRFAVAAGGLGLEDELKLIDDLDRTLTKLSGHAGEAPAAIARDPVTGLPR